MAFLSQQIAATRRREGGAAGYRQTMSRRDTIPASVMGWNVRDALAKMKPEYAIRLDNYFPELGAVRLRRGYTMHRDTGSGANVETLFAHTTGSMDMHFAAAGGVIYDITTPVVSEFATGQSSNRWQYRRVPGAHDPRERRR